MNPTKKWDEQLIGMLQFLFITAGKHDLRRVAHAIGMDYNDLYPYITGRRTLPTELLRKIVETTRDKVFLDVAWAGSPVRWEWREVAIDRDRDAVLHALEVADKIVQLTGELRKGLIDGDIAPGYKQLILKTISEARDELDMLFEAVAGRIA
jgi:hypothetical protein